MTFWQMFWIVIGSVLAFVVIFMISSAGY